MFNKAAFSEEVKKAVWQKAFGSHPEYRKDIAGAWMSWKEYGNRDSSDGWEIDHIKPESKGGSDDIGNLQALNWKNNASKADDYPKWTTAVTAKDSNNVPHTTHITQYGK